MLLVSMGIWTVAWAGSPTAFPQSALSASLGGERASTLSLGAAFAASLRYLDVQVGANLQVRPSGVLGGRLSSTALVFPTVGTSPPLALGVAGDVTWRDARVGTHLGVVAGLDMLYLSRDVPAVIDVYLAPGWTFSEGVSVAWHVEGRWYEEGWAWRVGASDLVPWFLGIQVPF